MVNRYITTLLIILAATGMEAQTYKSALKLVLTDMTYEEFIQQPEAKALEEDILSILKALKYAEKRTTDQSSLITACFPISLFAFAIQVQYQFLSPSPFFRNKQAIWGTSIVIRGPNY